MGSKYILGNNIKGCEYLTGPDIIVVINSKIWDREGRTLSNFHPL